MAIRLYVKFIDPEADRERFLQVSPGSVRKLYILNLNKFGIVNDPDFIDFRFNLKEETGIDDLEYAKYVWIKERYPEPFKIYQFSLYGLGRINPDVYSKIESLGMDPVVGSTEDPAVVSELLKLQGVDAINVQSVYWH